MKKLLILAMYTTILVVQDYLLSFIPNIQLSMLLVVLATFLFKFREVILITTVYVLVDNLLYGGLTLYTIPMLLAWYAVIVTLIAFDRMFEVRAGGQKLSVLSILLSVIYALPFMAMTVYLYDINLWAYIVADIPFWILMGFSSYVSLDLLYKPLMRLVEGELNR